MKKLTKSKIILVFTLIEGLRATYPLSFRKYCTAYCRKEVRHYGERTSESTG